MNNLNSESTIVFLENKAKLSKPVSNKKTYIFFGLLSVALIATGIASFYFLRVRSDNHSITNSTERNNSKADVVLMISQTVPNVDGWCSLGDNTQVGYGMRNDVQSGYLKYAFSDDVFEYCIQSYSASYVPNVVFGWDKSLGDADFDYQPALNRCNSYYSRIGFPCFLSGWVAYPRCVGGYKMDFPGICFQDPSYVLSTADKRSIKCKSVIGMDIFSRNDVCTSETVTDLSTTITTYNVNNIVKAVGCATALAAAVADTAVSKNPKSLITAVGSTCPEAVVNILQSIILRDSKISTLANDCRPKPPCDANIDMSRVIPYRREYGFSTRPLDTDNYVGCYRDFSERVMDKRLDGNGFSISDCRRRCRDQPETYPYAGLESYGECWCSYEKPLITSSNCLTRCDADIYSMCGGAWALSVYKSGATMFTSSSTICNRFTGNCIENGGGASSGSTIAAYGNDGNDNKKWIYNSQRNTICNVVTGNCLGTGYIDSQGDMVKAYPFNTDINLKWTLDKVNGVIISQQNGRSLENGGGASSGDRVRAYTYDGHDNKRWSFTFP